MSKRHYPIPKRYTLNTESNDTFRLYVTNLTCTCTHFILLVYEKEAVQFQFNSIVFVKYNIAAVQNMCIEKCFFDVRHISFAGGNSDGSNSSMRNSSTSQTKFSS